MPRELAARAVLLWSALGLVAGAAVGALVHLETRSRSMPEVVYHGHYALTGGVTMSRAYESTLNITYDVRAHHPELGLLTGIAVGLLAGLVVGLLISAWPTGRARR